MWKNLLGNPSLTASLNQTPFPGALEGVFYIQGGGCDQISISVPVIATLFSLPARSGESSVGKYFSVVKGDADFCVFAVEIILKAVQIA